MTSCRPFALSETNSGGGPSEARKNPSHGIFEGEANPQVSRRYCHVSDSKFSSSFSPGKTGRCHASCVFHRIENSDRSTRAVLCPGRICQGRTLRRRLLIRQPSWKHRPALATGRIACVHGKTDWNRWDLRGPAGRLIKKRFLPGRDGSGA